jgi:hypothetical protein
MVVYSICLPYIVQYTSRNVSLISDNISEMLPQLPPLCLYVLSTVDNWIMPYFERLSLDCMKDVNDLQQCWIRRLAKLIWLLVKGSRGSVHPYLSRDKTTLGR